MFETIKRIKSIYYTFSRVEQKIDSLAEMVEALDITEPFGGRTLGRKGGVLTTSEARAPGLRAALAKLEKEVEDFWKNDPENKSKGIEHSIHIIADMIEKIGE